MTFKLEVLNLADAKQFKIDAQDAFQKGLKNILAKATVRFFLKAISITH